MRVLAYLVADGARINLSPELYRAAQIKRYGVWGVMGRPLSYEEITAMDAASEVYSAYREMSASGDFVAWSAANPEKSNLLLGIMGSI